MEFEIINDKESNLADKGYCWKKDADLVWDQEYWKYQEQIHDENVDNAFDVFLEGQDAVCKGEDGKLYSVMFRCSEHKDGSYWYRPVIWQEVEPISNKIEDDMNTEYWMDTDIRVMEIDGARYELNGWNGEKYLHCWKCVDRWTADPDDTEYEIAPVYDMNAWNDEDGEFQDEDGNAIDGIIGFEVL